MRIQIVEDHESLSDFLVTGLTTQGFSAEAFDRGDAALAAQAGGHYDAVVLDLGLPGRDGLQVLRSMREGGNKTPVLILTSRVQVADRVEGLNAGADDYMAKPFAMEEFVARVNALLRRPPLALDVVLAAGNLTFDPIAKEIRVDDDLVSLTPREAILLHQLLRRSGKVVRKDLLEDDLFGASGEQAKNSVEVLLHRLRKKIESAGAEVTVRTVRGVGYMLSPN